MSITLQWDNNERNILRLTFDGVWTPTQVDRALALTMKKVRAARVPMFVLMVVPPQLPDWTVTKRCSPIDDWPINLTGVICVHEDLSCQVMLDNLRQSDPPASYVPHLLCVADLTAAYETLTIWHLQAELQR